MRFADPILLWALLAVPAAGAVIFFALRARRRALLALVNAPVLGKVVTTVGMERRVVKAALLCGALAMIVLSLARPQWGMTLEPVSRRGVDVVLAIDVSQSMLAEDIRPSRLEKARSEAGRLAGMLQGDRVAVVAFAGSAATLCPLTLDHAAARIFLDALSPDLLTDQGTALGLGLQEIVSVFGGKEHRFKAAVIFSDGEDQIGGVEDALKEALDQGVILHTVGVGTAAGGPIPLRDPNGEMRGYKEDRERRVVTSRLQEAGLALIAEKTQGLYLQATAAEGEIDRIAEALGSMDKKEMQQRLLTRYAERFQIPLALALLLLVAEALIPERRRSRRMAGLRAAASIALIAALAWSPAPAESASSLLEKGNKLYAEGHYDEALKAYTEAQVAAPDAPEIQLSIGNVLYKKGEFDKAREAYQRAYGAMKGDLSQSARYNAGTANLSAEKYKEAIQDFRDAIKMNPTDAEARRNLELAMMRLQQMQQQQQQKSEAQNQQQDRKDDQDQKQQDKPDTSKNDEKQPPQSQSGNEPKEKPEGDKPKPASPDKKEKQEAERILDALRREDKPKLDPARERRPDRPPEKDW